MAERKIKKSESVAQDIWGNAVEQDFVLRDKYAEPPFTVFDTKGGDWIRRRRILRTFLKYDSDSEGIQGKEVDSKTANGFQNCGVSTAIKIASEAVYDPHLLETLFDLFCPQGGKIIDPFNGSHISGCLAHKLGYDFTGIDVRPHIIKQNFRKRDEIFPNEETNIRWLTGDSDKVLDTLVFEEFDLFNSCPPYADLVKYSKGYPIEGDISLLKYDEFLPKYQSIITKCCELLKSGCFATITVGEVRDRKTGELYNFVFDTVECFRKAGMLYWNSAILVNSFGSAPLRVGKSFEKGGGKLVPVHQNILVFKKP